MNKIYALILAVLIALTLCGCQGGVDTSTDPENMIDTPAVNEQRELQQRRDNALKDLCPYDRDEFN